MSSLAPPVHGEEAAAGIAPTDSISRQHGYLLEPSSGDGPDFMPLSPLISAANARRPLHGGNGLRQQPQDLGLGWSGNAMGSTLPTSAASAAASLTLQPAWAGSLGGSLPRYGSTSSELLLEQFSYPSLLPNLHQDQPPPYAQQPSLQAPEAQPAFMLPPVRLSIGQQDAYLLPAPPSGPPGAEPGSALAAALLRSPSGSADQKQALRGAALRQALQGSGSFPSCSPGGGGHLQAANQQQAASASAVPNGSGATEEPRQAMQHQLMHLQPSLADTSEQRQEQYLLDKRKSSPSRNTAHEQPQSQSSQQLPGKAGEHVPSREQQRTGNSTGVGTSATEVSTTRMASTSGNGRLGGSLKSPSSPAKPSPGLPGLEVLRRKLRTSSDRCVRT